MTKKLLGTLAILGIFSFGLAQREAKYSYDLTKDFSTTAPLSSQGGTIGLSASRSKKQLTVKIGSSSQTFALEPIDDSGSPAQGSVLVEDFDFDGFNDVGVPSGIGYGGVNIFYDVWRYDPKLKKLGKLEGKDFEVSNPNFDTGNKILLSNARSGPAWYGSDFKFSSGKPWLYRTRNFVALLVFSNPDTVIIQTTIYNQAGKQLSSSIADEDMLGKPIALKRTVPEKMFLYTAPRENALTSSYIIRGDMVSILKIISNSESLGFATQQWVKIAYQSKKLGRIVRWLNLQQK